MIEHQFAKSEQLKRRMELVEDTAMGVRIGMGAKDWKPSTYDDLRPPQTDASKADPNWWPGKAQVSFGPRGISVR